MLSKNIKIYSVELFTSKASLQNSQTNRVPEFLFFVDYLHDVGKG